MTRQPKTSPERKPRVRSRKVAAFALPAIGSPELHALLVTDFVEEVRAVIKADWPTPGSPDVQVNTYPVDTVGQCIGTSPIPKYVSTLVISSEGLCRQCQEQGAGTQAWIFVRV